MDSKISLKQRMNGYTPSGCKITLISTRKGSDVLKLKNYVDTSSRSKTWGRELSPFVVGPVDLYDGHKSLTMENAWQFCKVFDNMVDANNEPTQDYWTWAEEGWASPKADRFPAGRGSKPLYSLWKGKQLGYMDARLQIYCRLYAEAVVKTDSFAKLKELANNNKEIYLADPDASDPESKGMDYKKALFDTTKPLSHSLVLAMLLCEVPIWEDFLEGESSQSSK